MFRLPSLALSLSVLLAATSATPFNPRDNGTSRYDFAGMVPTDAGDDILWTPCFEGFGCALLKVPLDYSNPNLGTANIAFIKKDSSNSSAQDILLNPGGPSNSGILFLINGAKLLEATFGSQYNFISFDPRGVNNSGPSLTCFPESEATQVMFGRTLGLPVDSSSQFAVVEAFQYAGGWGQKCSLANRNSSAQYANTVAVAQDMLSFIESRELCKEDGKKEDAKLWYYGISYGAVLGTTFASLYPERVGRLVLDAPMDMADYYSGLAKENLYDADAAVESFFQFCYEAGKDKCAFYANSTAAVEARWTKVLQDIKTNPIVVIDPAFVQMPTLATYQSLQSIILQASYAPISRFPALAQLMTLLEKRNGSAVAQSSGFGALPPTDCEESETTREYHAEEPRLIILANDANGQANLSSIDKFEDHLRYLVNQSYYLGESWAGATALNYRSLNLPQPPKSQQFDGTPSSNKTSPAILFLSNTIDPVSPLRGAQKMASLFPGSALVSNNGVGHGAITAPSTCLANYIQSYLRTGFVPTSNATCEAAGKPFVGSDGGWGKVLHAVF